MKSINAKLEIITSVLVYSLLLWILISGMVSNPATLLGFVFFILSSFVVMNMWEKLKEKITHSKFKIMLIMLIFLVLSIVYALIWGYFEIQIVPFFEI